MGIKTWWFLVTLASAALPGCISVPHVGSMWLDAGDPECAQLRARTHAQPLVFATLIDGALPAWRSRLDAPDVAGSSGATLARVGVATVRGLSRDASEEVTTILRIDRRASDGSIERTYAYAEGDPGVAATPPAEGFEVTRIGGEGLAIDAIARRGTERAILVGSQVDEGGAHGIVVFSPGSPGLILREAHCRAPREDPPSAIDAAPPPTVASDASPPTPAPVQVPDRVDVAVQTPLQLPAPTPVQIPMPTASP
jgi:hypothetical protein